MFKSEEGRKSYRQGLADARQGRSPRKFSKDAKDEIKGAYRRGWSSYRTALKQSRQLSRRLTDDEIFVKSMKLLWDGAVKESKPAKGVRGMIMVLHDRPTFRVYLTDEDGEKIRDDGVTAGFQYVDYDIQHYDLDVIIDEDAVLVTFNDGRQVLDYPLERFNRGNMG